MTRLIVLLALPLIANAFWIFDEDCKNPNDKKDKCLKTFDLKEKCWLPENRKEMLECKVTCGTCEHFACQNPQEDSVMNCTSLIHRCEDPKFATIMKEKCPFTCGKCDVKQGELCADAAGQLLCKSLEKYCNSLDFYDLMSENCASTCSRCPGGGGGTNGTIIGGGCRDYARDCAQKTQLCNNPNYLGLMTRACAKTCNKCGACEDATIACNYWTRAGFCSSRHYSTEVKAAYCRRSCGYCSSSPRPGGVVIVDDHHRPGGPHPVKPVSPFGPFSGGGAPEAAQAQEELITPQHHESPPHESPERLALKELFANSRKQQSNNLSINV